MTLYLVTGPPAAGKTTWVREHAQPGDITIDYDTIAHALTPACDTYSQPLKKVTKAARQAAIDAAIPLARDVDVYIIHAMPSQTLTDRYRRLGAHIITVDPGRDVVLERCKSERHWHMAQAAKQWYANLEGVTDEPVDDQALGQPSERW